MTQHSSFTQPCVDLCTQQIAHTSDGTDCSLPKVCQIKLVVLLQVLARLFAAVLEPEANTQHYGDGITGVVNL